MAGWGFRPEDALPHEGREARHPRAGYGCRGVEPANPREGLRRVSRVVGGKLRPLPQFPLLPAGLQRREQGQSIQGPGAGP